jgi:ppGpp synthetase/RelA/SpoT-type nucleotidyltranferase
MERVSRRKSSLPFARSVGFEVRNGGGGGFPSHEHQSRIRGGSLIAAASSDTADHSTTSSSSSDLLLHVQGFAPSISSSLGDSPLDTLALPVNPFPAGGGGANNTSNFQRETPAVLEAREKLLRLVEESNGLASLAPPSPPHALEEVDTPVPSSAIKLLESAQAQHKVFCDPTVVKAFRLADDAHKGQFRRNGDLYLTHCVETALILAATGAASTVVAAGLLHDAIDDSNLSQQLLRGAMGDEIADIVLGVSRLSEFSQLARDNQTVRDPMEADRLRNMILSMVDVRVVLIKLADRLHNMRTLGALSFRKQLQIANETLEIFAPLANRLGIWSWKAELEDLCFKHLKPEEYKELATRLSGCCREGIVMSSIHQLYEALQSQSVQFTDLSGRPKNLYSIYKKMMRKGRTVEEIFDVRGLRLIVVDEKSCYDALRIVHELWLHIPGQSKDYIVMPKPNGYQSLHTVVWGDDGYPLEVQIRTVAMHHHAEFGLAAHWRYKEDDSIHSSFILARVEWARWVLTWHSEILDTKLRLSPLRADLKPPCPFPVHTSDCPYASMCCGPQLCGTEPLLIIKVENENVSQTHLDLY